MWANFLYDTVSGPVLQQVDKCFVATQFVAAQAMRFGLSTKQLACHGLPTRPAFNLPSKPKAEVRQQLGMDVNVATVMLVGGGEGMGKLRATAEALAQTLGFWDTVFFLTTYSVCVFAFMSRCSLAHK